MKLIQFLFAGALVLGMFAVQAVPSSFAERVDAIVNALGDSRGTFNRLSELYKKLDDRVDELNRGYDERAALQNKAFECARNSAKHYTEGQEQCKVDTQSIIDNGKNSIADLSSTLAGIKAAAEREIAELTNKRNALIAQYNDLISQYDALVGDSRDAADKLLNVLRETSDGFDKLIDKRKGFVDSIDDYLSKLADEQSAEYQALLEIQKDICDAPALCSID